MSIKKTIEIEVETNVEDTTKEISTLGTGVEKITNWFKSFGKESKDALDKTKDSSKTASKGIEGVGSSISGLIKATGIIAIIVKSFDFFKEVLNKNQKVMDSLATASEVVFSIFSKIVTAIVSAVEATSNATNGFDGLGKVLSGTVGVALNSVAITFNSLKLVILEVQKIWENSIFGGKDVNKIKDLEKSITETTDKIKNNASGIVNSGKQVIENVGKAASETGKLISNTADSVGKTIDKIDIKKEVSAAKNLVRDKNNAAIAKAISDGLLDQYDRQNEKLRQVRDNTSNSIDERIKANDKLKQSLIEEQKEVSKNADLAIKLAEDALKRNKTTENEVALIQAKNDKLGKLATIEGQISEQLQNSTNLTKEKRELEQSIIDTQLENDKKIRDSNADLIENERTKYLVKKENLKLDLQSEDEKLQKIINNSKEGTKEYQDAINTQKKLKVENNIANKILDDSETKRLKEIEKQKIDDKISLNNRELSLLNAKGQLTIEKELEIFNKNRELERQKLIDAKATSDQLTAFDEESTSKRIEFAENEAQAKRDAFRTIGDAMASLSDIIGQETAAGKALAIAQATINTYLGITEVWKAKSILPEPFNTATKIAATITTAAGGFNAVKGILATKVPGGGGGGGSLPNTSSLSPTVSTASQTSPQTQLALSVANSQREPVKAYVVSNEMTTQQALDRSIKNNATFG